MFSNARLNIARDVPFSSTRDLWRVAVPSSRAGRGPAAGRDVDLPRAGRRRRRAISRREDRYSWRPSVTTKTRERPTRRGPHGNQRYPNSPPTRACRRTTARERAPLPPPPPPRACRSSRRRARRTSTTAPARGRVPIRRRRGDAGSRSNKSRGEPKQQIPRRAPSRGEPPRRRRDDNIIPVRRRAAAARRPCRIPVARPATRWAPGRRTA